jgi:uncharacterized membrane protein affecting hemolysin expression
MYDEETDKSPSNIVKKALALSFAAGLAALAARLIHGRKHRDQSSEQ